MIDFVSSHLLMLVPAENPDALVQPLLVPMVDAPSAAPATSTSPPPEHKSSKPSRSSGKAHQNPNEIRLHQYKREDDEDNLDNVVIGNTDDVLLDAAKTYEDEELVALLNRRKQEVKSDIVNDDDETVKPSQEIVKFDENDPRFQIHLQNVRANVHPSRNCCNVNSRGQRGYCQVCSIM